MTTATLEVPGAVEVTEPGVYLDIPELDYHRDPVPEGSLSCSGAKKLLVCPALFKHEQDNPPPPKRQYDFGHAAHKLVLGVGLDIEVIDADNYRTKAAQDQQKEARARGAVPLLRDEWATVQAMAAALREHPLAGPLLAEGVGRPEVSLFRRDPATNVMLRSRLDWLPHATNGRMLIVDYKTAASAEPRAFGRAAATYGYAQQDPWYRDMVVALDLADDPAFLFVVQEKEPPFLVTVGELDAPSVRAGRERNRRAIDRYLECMTTDTWPGYADDVALFSVPAWYERDNEGF